MAVQDPDCLDGEARWSEAILHSISEKWSIQIAGLSPRALGNAGHTCFARLVAGVGRTSDVKTDDDDDDDEYGERRITLSTIVQNVLLAAINIDAVGGFPRILTKVKTKEFASDAVADVAVELLQIGAVWIIPAVQDSQSIKHEKKVRKKKPYRTRLESSKELSLAELKDLIIRIHYGAIRFLDVYKYDWGKKCFDGITDKTAHYKVEKAGEPVTLDLRRQLDAGRDSVRVQKSTYGNQGIIIHEDLQLGYAIVNKPPGVPVHGYVYNDVENVAYMYGKALATRYPNEKSAAAKVSVPQRLDTETSGVLVVATKPSFSSYFGKLLEAKTLSHVRGMPLREPSALAHIQITKRYKCLVCLESLGHHEKLEELACTSEVVTHYLSSERTIPRIFADRPSSLGEAGSSWMQCQMRIKSVGFHHKENREKFFLLHESEDSKEIASHLWGVNVTEGDTKSSTAQRIPCVAVTQVEVELLTGRTHQIRGQMAKLGFPLVGDKLYGGGSTTSKKLGLHCCSLSFPRPIMVLDQKRGKRCPAISLQPSSQFLSFRFDRPWWHEYFK